ncbi:hypothetical protein KDA_36870 [Dictyobacter alpinus]|uniref:RNA polymerase sigma factor 70 region 4 type 2 domain-containing protein n=1 Tax=Dictyobacter alpinus TaxID=2014873 RepID=A0A402B9X8_9CHLR|nr:sigma factor-like helix-turn-helix DNA-binding protein [Dictyobacter alpinus]GCE28203.1 hypothetical protein KDA_36870 [Dictyobacter alpinus]
MVSNYYADVNQRRSHLLKVFETLPAYDSQDFWSTVEQKDFPREVLVKSLRAARQMQQDAVCEGLASIIVARSLAKNEFWAKGIAQKCYELGWDEQRNMSLDLCADLNEAILKAIFDPQRHFWEENFVHCLGYERMHVYRSFMLREGRLSSAHVEKGRRIPRSLVYRLDDMVVHADVLHNPYEIEDERAYAILHAIDSSFLMDIVKRLPQRLAEVVHLVYWEDKTEKDIATILGISDRTVRNRLQMAMRILSQSLICEPDCMAYIPHGLRPDPDNL